MKKFDNHNKQHFISLKKLCNMLCVMALVWFSAPSVVARAIVQDQPNLTFTITDKTLVNALEIVEQKSGFSFFQYDGLIDSTRRVSLKAQNMSLKQVLDKLFENTGNSYVIDGKQVYITKKKSTPPQQKTTTEVPKIVAKGVVVDNEGNPIVGASVIVLGGSIGIISDTKGNFYLSNVPKGATLQVSYVGYQTRSIMGIDENFKRVEMLPDLQQMEEVVVVGYGTQLRSMVTSAIGKMNVNEGNMRQVTSPTQLLNGRIAGVATSTSSGNLGSGERLTIRGSSSLSASNEPLYVIDGVVITNTSANLTDFGESMSTLSSLNISDIESMEVLKDAASAAIYGSRATNGVVIITTKSGRDGRSDVNINFDTGITTFPNVNKIEVSDSKMYIEDYNTGVSNYNKQNGYKVGDTGYKTTISNPFGTLPDTDWMDLILRTGVFYNADASFSGGNKKTKYYVGANYNHQEGIIETNKLNKMNFKVKLSHEFTPWLEVGANTSGNYMKNYQVPGADVGTTIIARGIQQRPFDRPYKPNGDYYVGGTDELVFHNPMQILNEENCYFENLRYLGNFYATFKYKDKVAFKSSINTDITQIYDYKYYNERHPYGTGTGRIVDRNKTIKNILAENFITYNDKFDDFSLNAMLGHSYQQVIVGASMIDGRGYPSPSFDVVGVAAEISGISGSLSSYVMESYFGRATLAYKDRYIVTGTYRTDGSSKFAPKNRWGRFPSVSFGWNISKEEFMADSQTDLKFRVSYGKTGNQEGIGSYASQALMAGGLNYGGLSGIGVTTFGNPDLTWEKADQYDVGFDVAFLNGKVNVIFDAYLKNTKDLLYSRPIQATSGVTSIMSNIGSMRNVGTELTVNTHFNFGKFSWLSQFNIATNRNEITSLLDDGKPISIGANRALQVGKELGAFYLFEQEGIFQYDGEVPKEQYAMGRRAGDVKWRDVDGNNIINDSDRQVMGSSNPDFFGGWNNTFQYKGLQLDVFFTYMYGNDVLAQWRINMTKLGHSNPVLCDEVRNSWTGPGTTNKYPRSISSDNNNVRNSDRILEDGSFIRLRSLTLSYTFPKKIASKLAMKNLRVFFQGDNLFLLTKYSGWDPEVSNNMDPAFFGVDLFSVPQPRTYSFGVNITF